MSAILWLSAAAFATSVLSGIAGLGGGIILIGVLFATGMTPALALPLHAGVQLASNGSRSAVYAPHIRWLALALYLLTSIPGPFLVAPWVVDADPNVLRVIMAVFILLGIWPVWARYLRMHGAGGMLAAGLIAGVLGPLVGGTGALVAPFFLRDDWRKENVIATMAFAQMCGHALKIAAFWLNGYNVFARIDLLLPMAVAATLGSLAGRRLGRFFSEARFRVFVRLVLFMLAVKLAWDGVNGILGG